MNVELSAKDVDFICQTIRHRQQELMFAAASCERGGHTEFAEKHRETVRRLESMRVKLNAGRKKNAKPDSWFARWERVIQRMPLG